MGLHGAKLRFCAFPGSLNLGQVPVLRCLGLPPGAVWPLALLWRSLALGLRAGGLASGFARSGRTPVLPGPTFLVPGAPRPGGVGTGTSPVRAAPGTTIRGLAAVVCPSSGAFHLSPLGPAWTPVQALV
eukprot:89607-Amphidinium_carterae.2